MIKLKEIKRQENGQFISKVQIGSAEFPATMNIARRHMNFTISFDKPYQFMFLSHVVSPGYDAHVDIDWSSHRKTVELDNDFPWDEDSKKILRNGCREFANDRFDKSVRKTGLLDVYKKYKKQGARLYAKDYIRNDSYRAETPCIKFVDKPYKISWNQKDEKIICTEERRRDSGRYRSRYDHTILSGNTVAKFTKKLDRYLLNQFLGISKKDLEAKADED